MGIHTKLINLKSKLEQYCRRSMGFVCAAMKELLDDDIRIWMPSWKSFGAVLLFISILGLLSNIFIQGNNYNERTQDYLVIIAIMGTLLIAIAMLVAPYLIGNRRHIGKILLAESYFFPLIMAELIIAGLYLILGDYEIVVLDNFLFLPLILLIICMLYSLYNLVRVLLSDTGMDEADFKVILSLVKYHLANHEKQQQRYSATRDFFEEKLKSCDLMKFMKENTKNEKYEDMKLIRTGTIVDFKWRKLKIFSELLWKMQNKSQDGDICILQPRLHDLIGDERNYACSFISINKKIINEDREKLRKSFYDIFVISEYETSLTAAENEYRSVAARCLLAIREKKIKELERTTKLFCKLLDEFVRMGDDGEEKLYSYIIVSSALGEKERKRGNVYRMLHTGVRANDQLIMDLLYDFVFSIAIRGIAYKRVNVFLLYRSMQQIFFSQLFSDNIDPALRKIMQDKAWACPRQLIDNELVPLLKKGKIDNKFFLQYAQLCLTIFEELLIEALDNKTPQYFKLFIDELYKLQIRENGCRSPGDAEYSEAFQKFNLQRQSMLFSLASWTLHLYENNQEDERQEKAESYLKIYEIIADKHLMKNKNLSIIKIFFEMDKGNYDDRCWWLSVLELRKNEEVISYKDMLPIYYRRHFIIYLLKHFDDKVLESKQWYIFLFPQNAKVTCELIEELDMIQKNKKQWEPAVLNAAAFEKIEPLKKFLAQISQRIEDHENRSTD